MLLTDWNELFHKLNSELKAALPFTDCGYVPAQKIRNRIIAPDGSELTLTDREGDYFYLTIGDKVLYLSSEKMNLPPDLLLLKIAFRLVVVSTRRNVFQCETAVRTALAQADYGKWAEGTVGIRLESFDLSAEKIFRDETGTKESQSLPAGLDRITLFAVNGFLIWETTARICAVPEIQCA